MAHYNLPKIESKTNEEGYFGPDSITWRLYREPLVLAGGLRALLLQVAHPSVADGVARFSQFKTDPLGRGYRTFAAMALIYFGSKTQAEQTAQRLNRMHSGIQGNTPQPYSANDPELLLWVFATLTHTTLEVFDRMPLRNLPKDWRLQFYEESKIAARLLGIEKSRYPADLQAFEQYFQTMLQGETLGSVPVCREVALSIVEHPYLPKKLAQVLAGGWLPEALCERLGVPVTAQSAQKLQRLLRRIAWFYGFIPSTLRWNPAYHQAQYRIAKARGKTPLLMGRFFNFLSNRMKIPMGLS